MCALFNARANVGEARFVCPLCRLRNVVTDKPRPKPAEKDTAEVCTHHTIMQVMRYAEAECFGSILGVARWRWVCRVRIGWIKGWGLFVRRGSVVSIFFEAVSRASHGGDVCVSLWQKQHSHLSMRC